MTMIHEANGWVKVTLITGEDYDIGTASEATVNISDNDPAKLTISNSEVSVNEADGSANIIVSTNSYRPKTFQVEYTTSIESGDMATSTDDFTGQTSQTVTVTENSDGIVSIPIIDDSAQEDNETFTVTLSATFKVMNSITGQQVLKSR